jgi:threonine aldolase
MNYMIDLRSDTVTLPPPEMREAMTIAELGDDVYGEDPTVNALESLAARMLGKEASILVPSGTMANLLAIMVHCSHRKKLLVGDLSDIWKWEAGGASVLGGLVYHTLSTRANGELWVEDIRDALYGEEDSQCVPTGLICLEDTHCLCGGRVLSLEYLAQVYDFARDHDLPVHLDGARMFNAAVATDVSVSRIAGFADSVSICLSKGLAAPVGSLIAGRRSFIAQTRKLRKMIGGGMRQAGVLAAAGIYALEQMVERLADDHANARHLAAGLSQISGIQIDPEPPQTNIVFWTLSDPKLSLQYFIYALQNDGVQVSELGKGRIRAVTHYGIGEEEIEWAVKAVRRALARSQPAFFPAEVEAISSVSLGGMGMSAPNWEPWCDGHEGESA